MEVLGLKFVARKISEAGTPALFAQTKHPKIAYTDEYITVDEVNNEQRRSSYAPCRRMDPNFARRHTTERRSR